MKISGISDIPFQSISDSKIYTLHPYLKENEISPELLASCTCCGIINPPYLLQNHNGSYDIISGRKRLYLLQHHLKHQSCLCHILKPDTSPEKILVLLTEEQFTTGGLHPLEQASLYSLTQRLLKEQDSISQFLRNLPPGRITKGLNYLRQLENLDASIKRAIHRGMFAEKAVIALQRFNTGEQLILLQLCMELQLNLNKQKNLLTGLYETIKRQSVSVADFLDSNKIRDILSNQNNTAAQKAEKLLHHLYILNYPNLTKASEEFKAEISALALPPNCRVEHSPAFERSDITCTITFSNLQELQSKKQQIKDCATLP